MRLISLLFTLLLALPGQAAMYKWVDEQGNISFSDRPQPGAEQLEEVRVQTYKAPSLPATLRSGDQEKAETEAPAGYDKFRIVNPEPEEAIRDNGGTVVVQLNIVPGLQAEAGHRITVTLDGKAVIEGQSTTQYRLTNVERGTHTVQATVSDESGVVASSQSVTFHLLRHSVQHNRVGATPSPSP